MCGGGVCFGHVSLKRPALYDFLRRTTTPHSSLLTQGKTFARNHGAAHPTGSPY